MKRIEIREIYERIKANLDEVTDADNLFALFAILKQLEPENEATTKALELLRSNLVKDKANVDEGNEASGGWSEKGLKLMSDGANDILNKEVDIKLKAFKNVKGIPKGMNSALYLISKNT